MARVVSEGKLAFYKKRMGIGGGLNWREIVCRDLKNPATFKARFIFKKLFYEF